MVKYLKHTKAFLQLIRIQNLLIIAATMYMVRYMVVKPILEHDGFELQLSALLFFMLVCSTVFLAAGGYVINDYFDRKTDLINRPKEVILGRLLRQRAGMLWHIVLTGIGIVLGAYVSYKMGHLKFTIIFVFVSGLLWFYSTTYKRQPLLGNLIVALLVAFVPLMVLLFEIPLLLEKYSLFYTSGPTDTYFMVHWVLGYAIFAFLLTLIREITKDLEDFEGDRAYGCQTIPIAWGDKAAKLIAHGVSICTIGLLGFALFKFRWSIFTLLYGVFLIIAPLILISVILHGAKNKKEYRRISLILKLIMLAGILYMVAASHWVF